MSEHTVSDKIDILLVDDRQENLISLEAVLACPEYNLIKAKSGAEALRYLLDHTPSLIMLDVQMPGMNGFETAALIKSSERTREIPIIFVTAVNRGQELVYEGYAHGAVDYIYKPYDAHVLKAKVAVIVDIRRQHDRIARMVNLQRAATQALALTADIDSTISNVLKSICTSLQWDLGTFWRVDRLTHVLRCQSEWHHPSRSFPEFTAECFQKRFAPGVGIPGRAWSSRTPIWVQDFSKVPDSTRVKVAAMEDLRTVVAFPVFFQDETLGVLELCSHSVLPEDVEFMKMMSSIGSQIGQVLKRAEAFELVRVSEARKTVILESALDCIISMDHEGRIIEFNSAAEKTFERRRAEVVGKKIGDIIFSKPEHREQIRRHLAEEQISGAGLRTETVAMRSSGAEFAAEISITRVPSVEPPLFTCFLRDITERKKVESNSALLMEASASLSSSLNCEETFSSIANLAVKSIADWCLIEVNAKGDGPHTMIVAHTDPSKQEMASLWREKFPTDWNANFGAPNVVRTGRSELYSEITEQVLTQAARDPEHFKLMRDVNMKSAMVVPLAARGKTLGAISFISTQNTRSYSKDDLVVAEELARRAGMAIDNARLYSEAKDAIRTRDEFFSIASHELKTPITALKLMIQMAKLAIKPGMSDEIITAKLHRLLDNSNRQVDQLTHLVDDLLDVVKIRAGKLSFHLEELNLSTLIQEVVERYSDALAAAKCTLKLEVEDPVTGVWDRTRLEQIVVNLLSNAIKYAPGQPILVHLCNDKDSARLTIRDHGPGIPHEQQAKIFERFERAIASRKTSGLGLGLFIVKQIVEAHHGTIAVDSQEGRGSTFIVNLPSRALAIAPQQLRGVNWKPAESSAPSSEHLNDASLA